jgi:hypothetical protein
MIIANERGALRLGRVRRVLPEIAYSSTLNKNSPVSRPVAPPTGGTIVAIPNLGGLHHQYERHAA